MMPKININSFAYLLDQQFMSLSGSNTRPQRQYVQNAKQPQEEKRYGSRIGLPPRPLVSPSNKSKKSIAFSNKEQGGYLANLQGAEIDEDRLHKSKSRTIKLNQSQQDTTLVTSVRVHDNVITVKEEIMANSSSIRASRVEAFKSQQFQDKKIKKFTISALIKEKDLIKQSNYFDESHLAENYFQPVVNKANADFRMGEIGALQTFQVKTYLYDRNLNQKINK